MCEPHLQHCMYDLSVGSFWNRTLGNELLHISSFKLQFHAYWHETQATRLFLYYAATERSFGAHWHTSSTPEIEKVFEDFSVTITLRSPSSRDPRHCHVSASISPPPLLHFLPGNTKVPFAHGRQTGKAPSSCIPWRQPEQAGTPQMEKVARFFCFGGSSTRTICRYQYKNTTLSLYAPPTHSYYCPQLEAFKHHRGRQASEPQHRVKYT